MYAEPVPVPLREARRQWAELSRRIFKVEPLACPRCGQTMRIVVFITEPRAIDRRLDHLRRIRNGKAPVPVPRPREPGGLALRPVPVPPRERCCTGSPGSWVRGYLGCTGVPMTEPQAGQQPSSGANRPVPGIRATGDCPGTLIPLAGHLQ